METPTWFDVAADYGFLELAQELTAPCPALELHLVIDSETDGTIAWWAILLTGRAPRPTVLSSTLGLSAPM
jgi:hypothetical protein